LFLIIGRDDVLYEVGTKAEEKLTDRNIKIEVQDARHLATYWI
jgi:hypothetical protein